MRTFKKGAKQALKTDVLEELAQAEKAQLATAGAATYAICYRCAPTCGGGHHTSDLGHAHEAEDAARQARGACEVL